MKYAACTMCKNEIHNVEKWLEHTKDFDYHVVVDTGSTDGTLEILREADVILDLCLLDYSPYPFRFDTIRNVVASRVPTDVDWLFWPDMDEYYSPNWREEMEDILERHPRATRVLHPSLHYKDGMYQGPMESGTEIDSKVFKRGCYEWIKPVHEHPRAFLEETIVSTEEIWRYHYHVDRPEIDKLCFEIARIAVEEDPTDDWCLWFALRDAYDRGLYDDVMKYGDLYLKATKPHTTHRSLAYFFMAHILLRRGGMDKAGIFGLVQSISEWHDNPQTWKLIRAAGGAKIIDYLDPRAEK